MVPGDVVGGRFELERVAGLGGMGTVFFARDQVTGSPVAVKVLFEAHVLSDARFQREAQLLSELTHPGLVRYVAHGVAATGERYLVMEWLEGEDLARYLCHARFSIEEAVLLGTRVAEALAAVHARGVIHRDLKPSNIFLVGRSIDNSKILDFGVARFGDARATTQTGMVLGTPGYMAPEQARTGQTVDTRADVFALGCVLYEALTGAPAFAGAHLMAMLAKILFEDAPQVKNLRPEVPDALDALVTRMLAKNPDDRPRDGAAVVQAIAALSSATGETPRSSPLSGPVSLTGGERRLLSVVLVGPGPRGAEGSSADRQLREIAEARGGRFERLADGSSLVTMAGTTRIAADQAEQGARSALALLAGAPARPIALATGRAEVTGRMPVGEAIDRTARMLAARMSAAARDESERERERDAPPPSRRPFVSIDDVTAGLLDARFDVRQGPLGFELYAEHEAKGGGRTLLGKPTVCVGRDREIGALTAMFVECVEAPTAQAVLVTSPAGAGKTRLVQEAIVSMRARGGPVEVWQGRGDSLRVGSAFSVLGQALRAACGVADGEHIAVRQQKIRARVARRVPAAEQRRVADFLGEIVGTPFPDEDSVPLRAARQDALIMGEQMRRAFEDFLAAETEAHPVVIVLEDLHWGDLPTVRFVDSALRVLKRSPWMVIALARPEVHELFPRLWEERGVEKMRLKELNPRACERLVRQVLGDQIDAATVARLVAQADGHAFFLEELIRAVAEGRHTLPETVLATVHARLEGFEVEARRVLRAASVFGEAFWLDGVIALLGGADRAPRARDWITTLIEREVLVRHADSRFPGQQEYAFRHTLLREASYAMLTESDLALGHKLAAEWLEARGESDPLALAEHFERGRMPERAGIFYARAAARAQRGGDTDATMKRASRGLECDVSPTVRISLLGYLCEAHAWRREWAQAEPYAEDVMRIAPPGSEPWAQSAPAKLFISLMMGRIDEFLSTLHLLQTVEPEPGAVGMVAFGLGAGAFILACGGRFGLSEPVLRRLSEIVAPVAERDPLSRSWLDVTRAFHQAWTGEAPWAGLQSARAGLAGFREAGHARGAAIAEVLAAMNEWFLGRLPEAERGLRALDALGDEVLGLTSATRAWSLVGVLADRGSLAEALAEAHKVVDKAKAQGSPVDEGRGRWLVAEVLRRMGDLETAEREGAASIELLSMSPLEHAAALATLAAIQLARGETAEALVSANGAMDRYEVMRAFGYRGSFVRLVRAEALLAAGDAEAARAALGAARDRLFAVAATIDDAETRRTFLEKVPENARILSLSREQLGGQAVATELPS